MISLSEASSIKLTKFISKSFPQKSETELQEIKYGLHILFADLFKLPVILLTAYLLGLFKYVAIAMICFGSVRAFASGVHAKGSFSCLLISLAIFLSIAFLSIHIATTLYMIITLFNIDLFIAFLYAPADTEKRPIIRAKTRKKRKAETIIIIMIYYSISIYMFIHSKFLVYINIFIFSISAECLMLTPLTYKFMKGGYNNYEKYI